MTSCSKIELKVGYIKYLNCFLEFYINVVLQLTDMSL